ncbi:gephyrin-like molybdotransferase Glp [Novosphingobium sp.]|uniref:molybdopterin molybdotransferase MoeA n=1 Tax=Novosphingobium sp. TaxID=1874826 RepID=UPI001ED7028A|nr:gephyrin-like molybdotransferase Glp [Novosphingobium sp.]MBK9011668.1 molybdopterin molybdotransferase MoeA [Novosphingobium sp.]
MALLPLDEAQARLLALAVPLPLERVPVAEALGRYLAEPLVARRTQPPADLSAMDGYAVRAADLPGPWRVIGESACGHPFAGEVLPGKAVRIATGALMPAGADMVLLQEDTARDGESLVLTGTPPQPPGRHIRRTGRDFERGVSLLDAGRRLGPAQIALALGAGHSHVAVRRRPRVVVIDSGDELSADPAACGAHQIPASNGAMIAAQIEAALPCTVERIGPVPDRLDALTEALERAEGADVVVTTGGASVGDHDLIRPALAAWGAELDFWKVAVKPGKPVLVARKGRQLAIGLPGNPVSSHVTAYLFLLPLLRTLSGSGAPLPRSIRAVAADDLPAGGTRREFLRAAWDGERVTPRTNQDSGALAALAASNCLIDRAANAPAITRGEAVTVYLLENGGIA